MAMKSQELSVILHGGGGNFSESHARAKLPHLKQALNLTWEALCDGQSGEEAVVECLKYLEDIEEFDCGFGAYPNQAGSIELDMGLINGEGQFASVLGFKNIRYPSRYALNLLREGQQHMFVWSEEVAAKIKSLTPELKQYYGYVEDNGELLAPFVKKILEGHAKSEVSTSKIRGATDAGTVGCVVRDKDGRICAGTSTGGIFNQPVGRIGDSPIIGAGVYADNDVCGLSATGRGEKILAHSLSGYVIAEVRRHLRANQFAFADDPGLLKEVLDKEFAEFSTKPRAVGALVVIPAKGNPSYSFNTDKVSLAMRWGTKTDVKFEDVLVDTKEGTVIR